MFIPDQIFEAIVERVFYEDGVCTLNPLSANIDSLINDVPIPYWAGNGNAGFFCGLKRGTRVLAMYTSSKGRETTVIAALIPKPNLYESNLNSRKPLDLPTGTIAYPPMVDGRIILRGGAGNQISLMENGDLILKTPSGAGGYFKSNKSRNAYTLVAEDNVRYSSGGKEFSGPVRRLSGLQRGLFSRPDLNEVPLFADPKYAITADSLGFFIGSRPLKRSFNVRKRNPEISEYRSVINEFSTDFMFTGFDDELARYEGTTKLYDNSDTYQRAREPGNTLYLAEHELIEIIGGNVVDINGNILDINYRALSYGGANNRVPTDRIDISYDRARRISRRGIGYHFQLATNSRSTDKSSSNTSCVFDIDKEGLIKINIPASTDTGNIPFASDALFTGANDGVDVSYLNPSILEPVPVTLRDENGEVVFPNERAQGVTTRSTGVRYTTNEDTPYFPIASDAQPGSIRVNSTKYHNMYAACERLIANTIRIINIPQYFTNDLGFPEGIAVGKPFEVPIPESLNYAENLLDLSGFREILGEGETDFPSYMSVVAVHPAAPAIDPGGETLVAGLYYNDDYQFPPYTNSFNSKIIGNEIAAEITDGTGDPVNQIGGKSAHLNLEGSLELSIGKDNFDQKSMMLDTDGGIISWLGKDKNGRSLVMQTDGEVLFNIGGSYNSLNATTSEGEMNVGRFELRVNVTDKKFVATAFNAGIPEEGGNPRAESDYIISISEDGIVIAGMKLGAPMIIRNDGPILMESTSSTVTLKGIEVKSVEPKGRAKSPRSLGR